MALALFGSASGMAAQSTPWSVGGGVLLESYSFSDAAAAGAESVSLLSVPFGARVFAGRSVDVRLQGYWARGTLARPDGAESTVSGLTDTWLTASVGLANDAVTLTAIGVLPTGSEQQTPEEAEVAGLMAADLFPFRVSNWGSGGGVGAQVGFSQVLGTAGVAASVGYILGSEFEPATGDDALYRPGNELRVSAAADFLVGRNGKLALQALWQNYGSDELDGAGFYSSGDRFHGLASYSFPVGRQASGVAYVRFLHRDRGEFDEAFRIDPTRDLIMAGAGIRRPALGGVIQPSADVRLYRQSDGIGQGVLFGLGGSGEWDAGSLQLVPVLRARFGSLEVREDASSSVLGFDAGLTVRLGSGTP